MREDVTRGDGADSQGQRSKSKSWNISQVVTMKDVGRAVGLDFLTLDKNYYNYDLRYTSLGRVDLVVRYYVNIRSPSRDLVFGIHCCTSNPGTYLATSSLPCNGSQAVLSVLSVLSARIANLPDHNLGYGGTIQSSQQAVVSELAMSAKGMRDVEEGTETAMRAVGSESKEKPMDTLSQSLASATLQQEPRDAPSRKEAEARPHASSWSARPAAIRKDPNAPKRGLQPYMFFANEQRENVKRENLGLIFGEILSPSSQWERLM